MTLLLLLEVALALELPQDERRVSPACWPEAGRSTVVLGAPAVGVEQHGLRSYSDLALLSPQLHDVGGRLFLGDAGRVSEFDLSRDVFLPQWDGSDTLEDQDGLPYTFSGGGYYWARRDLDADPTDPSIILHRVALDTAFRPVAERAGSAGQPSTGASTQLMPVRLTPPIAHVESAQVMQLLPAERSKGGDILFIHVEFAGQRPLASAIVEVVVSEGGAELRGQWELERTFDRWSLVEGDDKRQLALVDHRGSLSLLTLSPGAKPHRLDLTGASAVASDHRGLLIGTEDGCVLRYTLADLADPGEPSQRWCPEASDGESWLPDTTAVGGIEPLDDGRLLIRLLPDARGLGATGSHGGPRRVNAFMLELETGRIWALPVAEALQDRDQAGDAPIGLVHVDGSGRIWAAVKDSDQALATLRRLDLHFTPVLDLLARDVRAVRNVVQVAEGALALVSDGAGRLALRVLDGRGPEQQVAQSALDDQTLVAIAGGERGALVLTRGLEPGTGALWTLERSDATPALVATLEGLPQEEVPILGFWSDLASQELVLDLGQQALSFSRKGDRFLAGVTVNDPSCEAPVHLPSLRAGARVCAPHADDGNWTVSPWPPGTNDAPPRPRGSSWSSGHHVFPGGADGWYRWEIEGLDTNRPRIRVRNGSLDLSFISPTAREIQPLLLDDAATPVLLIQTEVGIQASTQENLAHRGAVWGKGRFAYQAARCEVEHRPRESVSRNWTRSIFSDARGIIWLGLMTPTGHRFLRGPVIPRLPELEFDWSVRTPSFLVPDPASQAPRENLLIGVGCGVDPVPKQMLQMDSPVILPQDVFPGRRCEIMVTNTYGLWQIVQSRRLASGPTPLVGFGLSAAALLAGVRLARLRLRKKLWRIAENLTSPYVAGPPVSGPSFFGRDAELATIEQELRFGSYVLLVGPKRIGKTSMLRQLSARMGGGRREGRILIPVYYSLERARGGDDFFSGLWWHLRQQARPLVRELELDCDISGEDAAFEQVWLLLKRLHMAGRPERILFLFDEFQVIAGMSATLSGLQAGQRLRSLTAEDFREQFCWVAAGIDDQLHRVTEISDLLGVGPCYRIGHLESEAARRLVMTPIDGLPVRLTEGALALLLAYSGGHPYLLQRACRQLLLEAATHLKQGGTVRTIEIDARQVERYTLIHSAEAVLAGLPGAADPGPPSPALPP